MLCVPSILVVWLKLAVLVISSQAGLFLPVVSSTMASAPVLQKLPQEFEATMLSFLLVPSLCRIRVVCKRWNRLISGCPTFSTLCLQNGGKNARYIVGLVVENVKTDHSKFGGWTILDLETQRWYRIKHAQAGDGRIDIVECNSTCVDTDGGLFCECVSQEADDSVVSIFNPLVGTRILRLPDFPPRCVPYDFSHAFGILNFVADDVDDSFKVFYINRVFMAHSNCGDSQDPAAIFLRHSLMPIFDSTTGQWRGSTNPLLPRDRGIRYCVRSVVYGGFLYVLFMALVHEDDSDYWLHVYNIEEDVWQDTGVHIRNTLSRTLSSPQLIVSDERLFLLAWMDFSGGTSISPSYYACEILLAEKALKVVFQKTSARVQLDFDVQPREWNDILGGVANLQAFGFKDSLIVTSKKSGVTIVYNLVSCSWDRWPRNPMMPLPPGCAVWYGKPMNLRLPVTPSLDVASSAAADVDGESSVPQNISEYT